MPPEILDAAGLLDWLKERDSNFADALADFDLIRVAVNQSLPN